MFVAWSIFGFCMNKTGIMSSNLSYGQKSITLNLFVFSGDPFSLRIEINY